MRKLFKRIDWKKFWKFELITFTIMLFLYYGSVLRGDNIFPENIYIIFFVPTLFGIMMLVSAHSNTLREKFDKNY